MQKFDKIKLIFPIKTFPERKKKDDFNFMNQKHPQIQQGQP